VGGRPGGVAHNGGGGTWCRPATGLNLGWGERAAATDGMPAGPGVGLQDEKREWVAWEERKKGQLGGF
jgi:hypothetical protein